uniref:Uncharacterized protein n=1 Tax=Arundo donax TaxID=35708 RepID=A0A0A9BZE2_ARUDO
MMLSTKLQNNSEVYLSKHEFLCKMKNGIPHGQITEPKRPIQQ